MGGSGGGSGGGGGSSGQIDYPGYMKDRHAPLYDKVLQAVETAWPVNPYASYQAFDPTGCLSSMTELEHGFGEEVQLIDPAKMWTAALATGTTLAGPLASKARAAFPTASDVQGYVSMFLPIMDLAISKLYENNPALNGYVSELQRKLDNQFDDTVLPKFRAGMRDNGAVMTSAYKIGEALLYARLLDEKVGIEKDIRGKLAVSATEKIAEIHAKTFEQALELTIKSDLMAGQAEAGMHEKALSIADGIVKTHMQRFEFIKTQLHYLMEIQRMAIAVHGEANRENLEYKVLGALWGLELTKYASDTLGSISGSAASASGAGRQSSRVGSAVGGAISGASTGAMIGSAFAGGPGIGTGIGAAVGGLVGLVGGLFG